MFNMKNFTFGWISGILALIALGMLIILRI